MVNFALLVVVLVILTIVFMTMLGLICAALWDAFKIGWELVDP
jgi:hypothetical protein